VTVSISNVCYFTVLLKVADLHALEEKNEDEGNVQRHDESHSGICTFCKPHVQGGSWDKTYKLCI
jgi:hypothetical protein